MTGTLTRVLSMENRNLKRPVALCLAVSVGGGWCPECGVQHQRAQHKAEDITENRKRWAGPLLGLGGGDERDYKLCTWKCFLQKKLGLVWICLFHLYGCFLSCIGIPGVRRGQQKASGPLELELQMHVSHHGVAGNWILSSARAQCT